MLLSTSSTEPVLAIPQQAVQRDIQGAFVMTVGADNVVELRRIEIATSTEGMAVDRVGSRRRRAGHRRGAEQGPSRRRGRRRRGLGRLTMISDVFIRRPRLAAVISIVIFARRAHRAHARCRSRSSPTSCRRRSRSRPPIPAPAPRWWRQTVAQTIEDQVIGVDNMIYMKSTVRRGRQLHPHDHLRRRHRPRHRHGQRPEPRGAGRAAPAAGRAADRREGRQEVLRAPQGVVLYAEDGRQRRRRSSRTTPASTLLDALKRVPGRRATPRSSARTTSAMRVDLDVDRLAAFEPHAADVIAAIRSQNVQAAIGRVGGAADDGGPDAPAQHHDARAADRRPRSSARSSSAPPRRQRAPHPRRGRRSTLGERNSDVAATFDGAPATLIGVYLAPGGNAIATADGVQGA